MLNSNVLLEIKINYLIFAFVINFLITIYCTYGYYTIPYTLKINGDANLLLIYIIFEYLKIFIKYIILKYHIQLSTNNMENEREFYKSYVISTILQIINVIIGLNFCKYFMGCDEYSSNKFICSSLIIIGIKSIFVLLINMISMISYFVFKYNETYRNVNNEIYHNINNQYIINQHNFPIPIRINQISINQYMCAICFEEQKINELWTFLNCAHRFHEMCINKWLRNNNTCPQCRLIIN